MDKISKRLDKRIEARRNYRTLSLPTMWKKLERKFRSLEWCVGENKNNDDSKGNRVYEHMYKRDKVVTGRHFWIFRNFTEKKRKLWYWNKHKNGKHQQKWNK